MRILVGFLPAIAILAQSAQPIPTQIPRAPAIASKMRAAAVPVLKVDAKYTPEARAAALEGSVSLYVEVDREGWPSQVQVMEGLGLGLDEEAVKAVQHWQFKPSPDADPIQDALEIDVPFRLAPPGVWFVTSEYYTFTIPNRERYGDIVRPVPVHYAAPDASACREPGTVAVHVTVGTDGAAHDVRAVEAGSGGAPGEAAVKAVESAVETWKFTTASGNGKKLEAQGRVEFTCLPEGASAKTADEPPAYRVSRAVSPPVLLAKVEPEYSELARKSRLQGTSILYLKISPEGRAIDIHVIGRLGMGLDQKAIEAVKHWRFKPGMRGDSPVTVEATVEVNFRLL